MAIEKVSSCSSHDVGGCEGDGDSSVFIFQLPHTPSHLIFLFFSELFGGQNLISFSGIKVPLKNFI